MSDRVPVHMPPGAGPSVWSLGGRFTVKLDDQSGDGSFSLVESLAFHSTEPPLHVHHREDEAWYVLDGHKGIPDTFTVDVEPTKVLVLAAPSGFEHFALELGSPATTDTPPADLAVPSPETLGPVAERYGIEVLGPPRRVSHPTVTLDGSPGQG